MKLDKNAQGAFALYLSILSDDIEGNMKEIVEEANVKIKEEDCIDKADYYTKLLDYVIDATKA